MDQLDRLGWAAGIAFSAYGLRVGIRVTDPAVVPMLFAYLPPGWKETSAPLVDRLYSIVVGSPAVRPGIRRFNLLYDGASRLARTAEIEGLWPYLQEQLERYVAEFARGRLFVHAGVVGYRNRAIVLPGPSRCGKSTLVAALLEAGATYYSDEYAVFDPHGRVHPFPRPLSMRDEQAPGKGHAASREHDRETVAPLPVGLLAFTHYAPTAEWRPRRLSPGEASLALMGQTLAVRRRPAQVLQTFRQVVAQADAFRG